MHFRIDFKVIKPGQSLSLKSTTSERNHSDVKCDKTDKRAPQTDDISSSLASIVHDSRTNDDHDQHQASKKRVRIYEPETEGVNNPLLEIDEIADPNISSTVVPDHYNNLVRRQVLALNIAFFIYHERVNVSYFVNDTQTV